jgi:hypothetical protein
VSIVSSLRYVGDAIQPEVMFLAELLLTWRKDPNVLPHASIKAGMLHHKRDLANLHLRRGGRHSQATQDRGAVLGPDIVVLQTHLLILLKLIVSKLVEIVVKWSVLVMVVLF